MFNIDSWLSKVVASTALVAIIWAALWAYSLYTHKRNHKELLTEIREIKRLLTKEKSLPPAK